MEETNAESARMKAAERSFTADTLAAALVRAIAHYRAAVVWPCYCRTAATDVQRYIPLLYGVAAILKKSQRCNCLS